MPEHDHFRVCEDSFLLRIPFFKNRYKINERYFKKNLEKNELGMDSADALLLSRKKENPDSGGGG